MNNKLKESIRKGEPSELQISEVHRIVLLIQKVNCSTFALVTETASELGIKKTALMQYIEDHPKNFSIQEITSTSAKGVKKTLGLGIKNVYLAPEENPLTEEWLDIKKKEWEKKIQVFEQTYYYQHELWYLAADDGKDRRNLWRTTPEKIQALINAGAIKMKKSGYGGLSDYYNWEGLLLTPDAAEAITKLGWELIYPYYE